MSNSIAQIRKGSWNQGISVDSFSPGKGCGRALQLSQVNPQAGTALQPVQLVQMNRVQTIDLIAALQKWVDNGG